MAAVFALATAILIVSAEAFSTFPRVSPLAGFVDIIN